ncbi:WD40 repeat domain-containing protein [Kitasatospora sp. NPDC048365]|uniref:WD40 repeat domain-containing protein n=1 Tax=Kitasatospora sp. NPDC048365 TaxID=3364050 RepID=UPI00372234CC
MSWLRRGQRQERAEAARAEARSAEWGGGADGEALADLHSFRDEVLALTALPPDVEILMSDLAVGWADVTPERPALTVLPMMERRGLVTLPRGGDGVRRLTFPGRLHALLSSRRTEEEIRAGHRRVLARARSLLPEGGHWWQLPVAETYLWHHLPWHLAGDDPAAAGRLVENPRWLAAKVRVCGVAAVRADLAMVDTPETGTARRVVERIADRLEFRACPDPVVRAGLLLDALAEETVLRAEVDLVRQEPEEQDPGRVVADLSRALVRVMPSPSYVKDVALSADGSWMVTASGHKASRIHGIADRSVRHVLGPTEGTNEVCAIMPDGQRVITGDYDAARWWDTATGRLLRTVDGWTTELAVDPGGAWCATDTPPRPAVIDSTTYAIRRLGKKSDPRDPISAMACSPDGRTVAIGDLNRRIRLWDPVSGKLRAELPQSPEAVLRLAFAPDGSWLATACRDGVRILGLPDGRERLHIPASHRFAVGDGGRWLAVPGETVRIHLADTGELLGEFTPDRGPAHEVRASPDGRYLATWHLGSASVLVWDARRLVR